MVLKRAGSATPSGGRDGASDDGHDAGSARPGPAADQTGATVQMEGVNAVEDTLKTVDSAARPGGDARDDGERDHGGNAPDASAGPLAERSSAVEPDPPARPAQPAQQVLDPRAIARASLEAGRNASLWWTSAGVVVAMVVALTVGTRAGAYTLAAVLAVAAVIRAVLPHPGPIAISVRAKAIDLTVLSVLAVSIAVLAQLLPGRTI